MLIRFPRRETIWFGHHKFFVELCIGWPEKSLLCLRIWWVNHCYHSAMSHESSVIQLSVELIQVDMISEKIWKKYNSYDLARDPQAEEIPLPEECAVHCSSKSNEWSSISQKVYPDPPCDRLWRRTNSLTRYTGHLWDNIRQPFNPFCLVARTAAEVGDSR